MNHNLLLAILGWKPHQNPFVKQSMPCLMEHEAAFGVVEKAEILLMERFWAVGVFQLAWEKGRKITTWMGLPFNVGVAGKSTIFNGRYIFQWLVCLLGCLY